MKKITLLLAFMFLGAALTFAQTAVQPSGSGSSSSPYEIATLNNLYWLSQNSGKWGKTVYYQQTADIDASTTSGWDGGNGFSPIGTSSSKAFKGHYDGNGHTIYGLVINRSTTNNIGLFGYTDGAEITDLGLRNASITGSYYTGGIVGYNSDSQVSSCNATGEISGIQQVGGIAAYTYNGATVENCYSTATVEGSRYVGGLVGQNGSASTVENSYSTGAVTGTINPYGGLVGRNSGTVTNSFWDTETSGQSSSEGGTGKTTAEMMQASTFTNAGWDFATIWRIDEGNSYPELQWQPITTEQNGPSNATQMNLVLKVVGATGTMPTISFQNSAPSNPVSGNFPTGIDHVSGYYWIIDASGLTSFNEASISVLIADLSGVYDETTLVWLKRSNAGDDWENIGGTITSGYLVSNSFTSFSEFAIGTTTGDNPLPVEIASFTGSSSASGVTLNWKTASETNNKGFTIYRNENAIASYSTNDALLGQGTKSSETSYTFIDSDVLLGETYTYTLVSEDISGDRYIYTTDVTVKVTETTTSETKAVEYELDQNYPNPFNPTTLINYSLKESGHVKLQVFDMLGRVVAVLVDGYQSAGSHNITFDASRIATSGMYFYRLETNNYTKVKKMMLLK
ncbi:GLUG domain protein [Chloroherpeton thalassium ATCC 35110]|uniref:GLUG domain protein n=1 Tax=Chloroherpeton thalassium (strain ATCC 35110 / GB-78) TaxID=517418 RepID=B3QVC7_CHLT3|nr:GLUG motif-containing protein [Chloroherpeton thalassium]ACF14527.1 GLUG domain protein [Chloroherpeton thalassium ATCC 35110]